MDHIINHFNQYLPLDSEEIAVLTNHITKRTIKRRQFLLHQGDVCKSFTYIQSGCFKMYGIDDKGAEHNLVFAAEDDWISDIGSLHRETPSQLYIEAIEPSVVLQISKGDLWYLYTNYPKFDRNFRVIIENKYIELQNRLLQMFSSTAIDRYESFINQYPNLANRLPNTQIASYLGITAEFLSKIKNDRFRK
ncbi:MULTISPECIES: Crp/Fnr family transcriptional regulator [Sphingobacterium]|uniref:Crp/Fnr family transcriptional regulator n=1 Tax=Sphingobacterium TaxID=28453 RepID=UPI000389DFB3|nr:MULTISPECIES: Crp/Fnr family transcriptional regulator [Sphingobacterium]MBB2952276.1 CRP-like cAMP-binding protein [Sphingobacterium sp. JUb56]MCW2260736.1 CRP-like cAMP-binding protein [Sphingobacterium kitahiroshimense]TCR09034.1 CRP-like cAMP-binding protein [Sphingobacterium sp. JUb78]